MENKKVNFEKVDFGKGYIYPNSKVYGCARIVPPEERKKLRENKQSKK